MKQGYLALTVIAVSMLVGCGQSKQSPGQADESQTGGVEACPEADEDGNVEITPGLTAKITNRGHGRAAVAGDHADVHTTLWLYDEKATGGRGTEIWTSGGETPFQFMLDAGQVIRGWDLGVACMLIGEIRELTIAPQLGYGERGKPPVPPNATLLFEIELVKLTGPGDSATD